jgi:hypothetical protein
VSAPARYPVGECEKARCHLTALCTVSARWSVVDFQEWESCAEHQRYFWEKLSQTIIEGEAPREMETRWYDPEPLPAF